MIVNEVDVSLMIPDEPVLFLGRWPLGVFVPPVADVDTWHSVDTITMFLFKRLCR